MIELPPNLQLSPPNILEICFDDVGYEDIASVPTPNIDRLIAVSIDFPKSYVTSPLCSPSRVSNMTGLYNQRFEIGRIVTKGGWYSLPVGVQTKAKTLKLAGYATGHFGKWHMNASDTVAPGLIGGFDTWRATLLHNPGIELEDGSGEHGGYFDWNRVDDGNEWIDHESYMTQAQAEEAQRWWSETEEPKFAELWFAGAHMPFHDPPRELLPAGWPKPTNEREQFEAMVMSMDFMIGQLMTVVDLDTTYVFLWSDNGTPSEVPLPGQSAKRLKMSMYEGGVNTPLYVHVPGQDCASTSDRLVSTVDFLDTYADIAQVQVYEGDGVSFANQLGVETAPYNLREWVYADRFFPNGPGPYLSRHRMLRTDDGFKLIRIEHKRHPNHSLLYRLPNEVKKIHYLPKLRELEKLLDNL